MKTPGLPVSKDAIQVRASGRFDKEFRIRKNDVYMLVLK